MRIGSVLAPALMLTATPALGDEFPRPTTPYSADYVMTMDGGGNATEIRGRIEVDGPKERHDAEMGGNRSTVILRLDRKVAWVLLPQQRMYFESSLDAPGGPGGQQAAAMQPPDDVELREIGTETIDGHATTKYEMKTENGQDAEGTLWMTEEKIPIRMEGRNASGKFRRELSNVETGKIDASRFELPEGYSKFAMPQIPQMPQGGAMQEDIQKKMQQMMENMGQ